MRAIRSRRDANEPKIIAAAESVGAYVQKLNEPVDLIVAFRGHNLLVEVKRPGGKIRESRQKWFWKKDWPGPRYIIEYPEQLQTILLDLPDLS